MSKGLKAMQDISDNLCPAPDLSHFDGVKLKDALELMNSRGVVIVNSKKPLFKISFDFDGTLSTLPMQTLCKQFMELGAEVYVTTSRADVVLGKNVDNSELFGITDRLGIDRNNITFTSYDDKYKFVKDMHLHFDDCENEILLINQFPGKCIGFLYEAKYDSGIKNF